MRTSFSLSVLLLAVPVVIAFPHNGGTEHHLRGKLIVPPPVVNRTGLQIIPDHAHPYIAPGPNDQRGPCPGLNTLANHGYLPRNGIASFEQIVNAVGEGLNMEYVLASALTAFGMLSRGNAYLDLLSIGGPSPLVPGLPGHIDGPRALGLATHGRFEGDVSMTRQDAAIGDNVHFQQDLFDELLKIVAKFGGDSPVTGHKSIVNLKSIQEFKFQRFTEDQVKDPKLVYHIGRLILSYGEGGFTLNFFANGTTGLLSVDTMTSFFKHQRFPPNFYRLPTPGGFELIGDSVDKIFNAHPVPAGANAPNGTYILDPIDQTGCGLYNDLGGNNIPGVLLNTTGILKKNVDTLLDAIFKPFSPDCPRVFPHGAAGI